MSRRRVNRQKKLQARGCQTIGLVEFEIIGQTTRKIFFLLASQNTENQKISSRNKHSRPTFIEFVSLLKNNPQ